MASAVDDSKKVRAPRRKHRHSKELLKPPKGPGVNFLKSESDKNKKLLISEPPKTFKVERSSVLSRVQSFLPAMKEADRELQKRLQSQPREELDIESVADGEACIQMDLALMPLHDQPSGDSSDSDSSSDSESDGSGGTGTVQHSSIEEKTATKRTRRKLKIEEVG